MIKEVIFFQNGMVMVFDENDKQVEDLQGPIFEVASKLGTRCDKKTKFQYVDWRTGKVIDLYVEWWFELRDERVNYGQEIGVNTGS